MSQELDYFPPRGTNYEWGRKELTYSPWGCALADQLGPKDHWPMNVHLYVDLTDGKYKWDVKVHGWKHADRFWVSGSCDDPLEACLEAEAAGAAEYAKLTPEWVRAALANGWRPPG